MHSIILYGVELLNHEHRKPIYKLENKMISMKLGKLLNLKRSGLEEKHLWSIKLVLGLPTLFMEMSLLVPVCIYACFARRRH